MPFEIPGYPAALTAIREFHRLRARWLQAGVFRLEEARQLSRLKAHFEPFRAADDDERCPVLIVDRRPIVIAQPGVAVRGELIAFALRTALLRVALDARLDAQVRLAIPRHPDGKWHRFVARVTHVDRKRCRILVRFVRPEGEATWRSSVTPESP